MATILDNVSFLSTIENAASEAADLAATITMAGFRAKMDVENKITGAGFDPVTHYDREAEQTLYSVFSRLTPDIGFVGEEFGIRGPADAQCRWVVDPIDGTRAFITGNPLWGTLIALTHNSIPIFGLIDMPVLRERFIGHNGTSRLLQLAEASQLKSSTCKEIRLARTQITDPFLSGPDTFITRVLSSIRRESTLARFGGDCYNYGLLAMGCVDLVVEPYLKDYDICAAIPILEAAGCTVSNWEGNSVHEGGHVLAACTPELHTQALEVILSVHYSM